MSVVDLMTLGLMLGAIAALLACSKLVRTIVLELIKHPFRTVQITVRGHGDITVEVMPREKALSEQKRKD